MRSSKKDSDKKICPRCNRLVLKLVFFNDNRTGQMMCIDCKRKMKKAEKIYLNLVEQ